MKKLIFPIAAVFAFSVMAFAQPKPDCPCGADKKAQKDEMFANFKERFEKREAEDKQLHQEYAAAPDADKAKVEAKIKEKVLAETDKEIAMFEKRVKESEERLKDAKKRLAKIKKDKKEINAKKAERIKSGDFKKFDKDFFKGKEDKKSGPRHEHRGHFDAPPPPFDDAEAGK